MKREWQRDPPFFWLLFIAGTAASISASCVRNARQPVGPTISIEDDQKTRKSRPGDTLDTVYSYALQGDMKEGLRILQALNPEELNAKDRGARRCLIDRFAPGEDNPGNTKPSGFLPELIAIYAGYWKGVLTREMTPRQGERYLLNRLNAHLEGTFDSLQDATDQLGKELKSRGYHSIRGVTLPYHELMVWKTEDLASHNVALPEGTISVNVVFMDEFVSLGWAAFATCNVAYSGGWAKEDTLYCVKSAWDTTSENFRVSYLAHESQHFADYKVFPELQQPELEYRAKLTELALAKTSARRLLHKFSSNTGTKRSIPHSFANRLVVRHLADEILGPNGDTTKLTGIDDILTINAAAAALLSSNTIALNLRGADSVEVFFTEPER